MKSTLNNKQLQLIEHILEAVNPEAQQDSAELKAKVTHLIEEYNQPGDSVQVREVTVLLSDIRGFTALSERFEAIQVVKMLNNYFLQMNEVILRHGGMIDKYMGDAIMVLFGVPEQHPDDALRAVNCAIEMQIAMEKVNQKNKAEGLPELFVGIGINSGSVSAGQIGSDLHNEYTVIGDEVNVASRIESHSLRGQVLISEHTYQKVKDYVEIASTNKVSVKGKSEMLTLYEVRESRWQKKLTVPRREIRSNMRVLINASFPFQILSGKDVLPDIHTAHAKDISYNGTFAIIQQPLEMLTDIKLSLSLSLLGGETRDIYGKIVSIRKMEDGYGCGIEFSSLDEDSQRCIKEFIDRIIEGS
jgi:adenylate cyclase